MQNAMLVHPLQEGNKLLGHIRHIKHSFNDQITSDYICGNSGTVGVLFISIRFHVLKPKYLEAR